MGTRLALTYERRSMSLAGQHHALVEGSAFAATLKQSCEILIHSPHKSSCFRQDFWNGTSVISNLPGDGCLGLDANSVLRFILTFGPDSSCDDTAFQPCSALNSGKTTGQAVDVGRYPGDVYQGSSPWYYPTKLAAAEQSYDALYQWKNQGSLAIHHTDQSSISFWNLSSSAKFGNCVSFSSTYSSIASAIKAYADDFTQLWSNTRPTVLPWQSSAVGHRYRTLSPRSHMVLSFFLTAAARRDGTVSASFGGWAAKPTKSHPSAKAALFLGLTQPRHFRRGD
ncbi:hypothetical protein N7523_005401 [Penicillium sp. IBT 18751x]|nr:hypothetical protein N7523_005401 [Penicillium sp. IBT 18751x]